MTTSPRRLDAATARKIAVEARCDPRTVQRVYAGQQVRGDAGTRAREVLIAKGILPVTTR
jgi:hypothetical protein